MNPDAPHPAASSAMSSNSYAETITTRQRGVLRDQRSGEHEPILARQFDIDQREVGLGALRDRERLLAGERARRHGHALGLEQRARGGEECPAIVDDETSLHHLLSIPEALASRNAASWRIERPGSRTKIGPLVAATPGAAVVILTGMLATETPPDTQSDMAPAELGRADRRQAPAQDERPGADRPGDARL